MKSIQPESTERLQQASIINEVPISQTNWVSDLNGLSVPQSKTDLYASNPTRKPLRDSLGRWIKGHGPTAGDFKKGNIPWNKKKFYHFEKGQKNYCKYCKAEIPLLNKGNDPQSYCKGHEGYANRGRKFPNSPSGPARYNWKERRKHSSGYWLVYKPDHPRAVYDGGHVLEHILIAEDKLGRSLKKGEVVNHKNGIRDDNRPENLEVLDSQSTHCKNHHFLEGKRVLIGDRRCCICNNEKTSMKRYKDYEVPVWYKVNESEWECKRCNNQRYAKIQYKKNVLEQPKIPGKHRTRAGYIRIKVPGHHRADHRGWVLEHIVVAEQKIGRQLRNNEQVHHIDGNKENNNPDNLDIMDATDHNRMHGFRRRS